MAVLLAGTVPEWQVMRIILYPSVVPITYMLIKSRVGYEYSALYPWVYPYPARLSCGTSSPVDIYMSWSMRL